THVAGLRCYPCRRTVPLVVRRTRDTPYGPGPTHEPVSPREPTPLQPLLPPARLGRQRVERRGVLRGGRAAALRKPRPVSSGPRSYRIRTTESEYHCRPKTPRRCSN